MKHKLFARKSISDLMCQSSDEKHALKRVLGPVDLTLIGVGGIIGAGIFVLTGQAAAQYAGPAIVLSFIISAAACAFAGLCYAEFASMIPIAGSAYTYAYATMGEFIAWIIGWDLVLEYLFASSTVAVGWSGYVVSFLRDIGLQLPPQITAATGTALVEVPGEGWQVFTGELANSLVNNGINPDTLPQVTALFNLPAVIIIAAITWLLVRGIRESVKFNDVIVFVKVAVVLLFIVFGAAYITPSNWSPFIPPNTGEWGHFGFSGIMRGAGVIFFAYIGFDAISTTAQEAKNPQRDMPIGILSSLAICTVLYIAVSLVLTGIVKYPLLLVPDPMAVGVDTAGKGLYWLRPLVKLGAIAGLSSVILVMLMGQPRIFFAMANDGLLPEFFRKVHPVHKTPHVTTMLTGIIAAIIAATLPIGILGELVSIGTLFAFAIVCVSVLVLRYKSPDLNRPFKTPWVPFVPVMGALAALAQMASLPMDTWWRLIIWMAIGLAIYFGYSIKHSRLRDCAPPPTTPDS